MHPRTNADSARVGLRVVWRLAIFVAIVAGLMTAKAALLLSYHGDQATSYLADKIAKFGVFLLASWIMARIEARKVADYGLPWSQTFGRQFWKGVGMALLCLSAFLIASHAAGLFRFGGIALQGGEIWKWAGLYAFGFIIVALEEEFHYRGYGLYTLAQAIGFWPAATLSSLLFGYSHFGNPAETWLGVFNAGAGGLLFCLLLRRSGSLWMPIGFHAAWDWTQTYFYGVPDSGQRLQGHLLNGTFFGPPWLSGGAVGPEGSVLLTLLLAFFLVCAAGWLRESQTKKK